MIRKIKNWLVVSQDESGIALTGGEYNMSNSILLKNCPDGFRICKVYCIPSINQGDKKWQYCAGDGIFWDIGLSERIQFLQSFTGYLNLTVTFKSHGITITDYVGTSQANTNDLLIPFFKIMDIDLFILGNTINLVPVVQWTQSALTKDVGTALIISFRTHLLLEY